MNKTAIKNFAIWARNKLIADISYKASLLGITDKEIHKPTQVAQGVEFYSIEKSGTRQYEVKGKEIEQRRHLADKIAQKARESDYTTAYKAVIEEVAYTWFNRLVAVRFMEVNDYLPSRVRVLSSQLSVVSGTAKSEPDIVTRPFDTNLEFTAAEREYILACKTDNKLDELFSMLFIKQCNALNALLPELFERIGDYTELLLNISFTDKDGVVSHLVNVEELSEDNWHNAVQIIGWMYQDYNTEPKDILINARSKYKMDDIPFVTQLFTSEWIVRFMVENSLGRYWLDIHPNDPVKTNWQYYLDEEEQTHSVQEQLKRIRVVSNGLSPEDIMFIDPCMGSGHILVYAFDVLMQIYRSAGYADRDAAKLILEKNLYGLDIDLRAYQLAYFALFMKARQYNRRILDGSVAPQVYHPIGWQEGADFGSLIQPDDAGEKPVEKAGQLKIDDEKYDEVLRIWNFKRLLSQDYDIVCTNPPYLNSSYMPDNLKRFINENYEDYKSDLFAAYFERVKTFCKKSGHIGMLTPYVWMFINSHEKTRKLVLNHSTITSLVQLEYNAFEAACIPVAAFTFRNTHIDMYKGEYIKLSDFKGIELQEPKTLEAINNRECGFRYTSSSDNYAEIPGSPVAYWVCEQFINNFRKGISIDSISKFTGSQNITANNEKYVRLFWEVNKHEIVNDIWKFYAKGGEYRKWYGNLVLVVDWSDSALIFYKSNSSSNLLNPKYWNKEGITYTELTSSENTFRYLPPYCIFDKKGPSIVELNHLYYCLGLLNSKIASAYFDVLNPSMSTQVRDVKNLPLIIISSEDTYLKIENIVRDNVNSCQDDWNSFETSWDFKRHPLV